MSTVRLRRLQADYEKLREFAGRQPRLRVIAADGQPPEVYQLEYHVAGLRQIDDQLHVVKNHMVEIRLPRDYPRTPPQCRMLTPIFHPNIAPHAICIGDHWNAGEPLWSMVARIGEMIAYQSYNVKSPLNGEAARWVEQNLNRLPLDRVNMRVDEGEPRPVQPRPSLPLPLPPSPQVQVQAPAAAPRPTSPVGQSPVGESSSPPPSPPPPVAEMLLDCPGCGHHYKIRAQFVGRRVRCAHCQQTMVVPGPAKSP